MSYTDYGNCAAPAKNGCGGREFRLTKDGMIWHHYRKVPHGSGLSRVCPGAGKPPKQSETAR